MSEFENRSNVPVALVTPKVLARTATLRRMILIAVLLYPLGLALHLNLIEPQRHTMAIDFVAFWAAAKLAVQGVAITAFDFPTLQAAELLPDSAADARFTWLYPPAYHMLIAPLGYLPFSPAFTIFTALTVGAYSLALRPWVRSNPFARDLSIAAPAVAASVFTGNTSLLWAATFLAAMHGLTRGNPLQAGIFIALLTLKPQLGILIPVALLAQQGWRTIIWSSIFALLLALIGTATFGVDYWSELINAAASTSERHANDTEPSRIMVTWYAFLRRFSVGHDTALLIQLIFSVAAAAMTALVWSRRQVGYDMKIAVLLLATLSATPYAYQYESMLALLAALFLLRAGVGATPAGLAWLFLLWVLPLPGRVIPGLYLAQYAAPVIFASLLLATAIARRESSRPATA